jgi:hypothetical protein
MKKTTTFLSLLFVGLSHAQTIADFENFTLPADSFYYNAGGTNFMTSNATFQYDWDAGFSYWSGGFSYTNKNDSSNGGYQNLYNCIAYKGYNNSNYYATGQNFAKIMLTTPHNFVNGFYITNTTYAYKSMKSGDSFAKKFGGATGNDPDFFKVTVRAYLGGVMKTDSTEVYLADFRFPNNSQDFILNGWQYVNCSNLGVVDSVQFFMYSSDNGSFGMNTPAFFSIDNFSTSQSVGINDLVFANEVRLFPNPAADRATLLFNSNEPFAGEILLYDAFGGELKKESTVFETGMNSYTIELFEFNSGIYFVLLNGKTNKQTFKLIKN